MEYDKYCFLKGWVKLGQVIPVQIYVHVQRETVLCRGENLDSEARGRVASDQCVTQGGSQHSCGQRPHCEDGDNKGASLWGC